MQTANPKPTGTKTIDDLLALPEGTKAELINGEIVMMAPTSSEHSRAQAAMAGLAERYAEALEKEKGSDDTWVVLTEAWTYYDQHNSFSHDLAAFLLSKYKTRGSKGPIKIRPEWVCEILSPSNWTKDTHKVRLILEAHNVPYYWLVDPGNKGILVFKYEKAFAGYKIISSVSIDDGIVELAPFAGIQINLTRIFV